MGVLGRRKEFASRKFYLFDALGRKKARGSGNRAPPTKLLTVPSQQR